MSTLASKAEGVLARSVTLRDAEQVRQAQSQFAQRSAALEASHRRLSVALDYLRQASELGVTSGDESSTPAMQKAIERVASVRQAFTQDRSSLLDDTTFRLLLINLDALAESLEQSVVTSWARYTVQAIPPPLAGDEQLLRADPRNSNEVIDRILQWDDLLRTLGSQPKPTAAELTEFVTVLESRSALWDDVKMEEKPEVVQFIQASGGAGAPLELLTQPVRDWLAERGLTEAYVVKKKD